MIDNNVDVGGFGHGNLDLSKEQLDALNKALSAGYDRPPVGGVSGDGGPLRVESLEATLRNLTYSMRDLKLYREIPKLKAYNTVEDYNTITEFGDAAVNSFVSEGELPVESDATMNREFVKIKYLGTTRKVTHVMTQVRSAHGDPVALETINGTRHLLRSLERALFTGDEGLLPLQFDGFRKLIMTNSPAKNIIDNRGNALSEDLLTDSCQSISDSPNFGIATHIHASPRIMSDFAKTFFDRGRYDVMNGPMDGKVGAAVKSFVSDQGEVSLERNAFLDDEEALPAGAVGDVGKRPANPALGVAATGANANSKFVASDAGDYLYSVVACNRYGCSAPVALAGAVTVAAGEQVSFTATPGNANDPAVEYYKLYRSAKNGSERRMIRKIANTVGAAATTIIDINEDLPFTSEVYVWQQNIEAMSLKELTPLIKMPLATIDPSIRFMLLMYCAPVLYAPGRAVLIKNVGRAPGFQGQI